MLIVKQIFQLYFRKRATSDIGHSPNAALLLFFIAIAITTVAISSQVIFQPPLATAIAAQLIEVGVCFGLLNFYKKTPRFIQMITATMGVTIIANVFILLALQITELSLFIPLVNIWSLYLTILIFKEVLECSFLKALALVFAATFISVVLLLGMFGDKDMIEQIQQQSLEQTQSESPTNKPSQKKDTSAPQVVPTSDQ